MGWVGVRVGILPDGEAITRAKAGSWVLREGLNRVGGDILMFGCLWAELICGRSWFVRLSPASIGTPISVGLSGPFTRI